MKGNSNKSLGELENQLHSIKLSGNPIFNNRIKLYEFEKKYHLQPDYALQCNLISIIESWEYFKNEKLEDEFAQFYNIGSINKISFKIFDPIPKDKFNFKIVFIDQLLKEKVKLQLLSQSIKIIQSQIDILNSHLEKIQPKSTIYGVDDYIKEFSKEIIKSTKIEKKKINQVSLREKKLNTVNNGKLQKRDNYELLEEIYLSVENLSLEKTFLMIKKLSFSNEEIELLKDFELFRAITASIKNKYDKGVIPEFTSQLLLIEKFYKFIELPEKKFFNQNNRNSFIHRLEKIIRIRLT